MPPARRRGANKAKANGHLSLGDLVLAKVKGFPAWPAKISSPEDWDKPPDPKKYFVHFFGTEEIAFVAPADIQTFTSETKNKLSARLQGKTKHFAQAVKEICAAFDEIQKQKPSGLTDDTDNSRTGSEAPSIDGSPPTSPVDDNTCQQNRPSKRQVRRVMSSMQHQNAKRYNNHVAGMCVVMVTLVIMIVWGRLCAIVCTSVWLYFVPRFRLTGHENDVVDSNELNLDLDSKMYKKKVVLEGLLKRNHEDNDIQISHLKKKENSLVLR